MRAILTSQSSRLLPSYIIPDLFALSITPSPNHTNIDMRLYTQEVTTANMPHVVHVLKLHLPTILESTCFNEGKLPFAQEVVCTEIGHLFEHILLEYLCKEKIKAGYNEAMYSGVTKWNWNKEDYGTFHIHIDITKNEGNILYFALEQSIFLLKHILLTQEGKREILQAKFFTETNKTSLIKQT